MPKLDVDYRMLTFKRGCGAEVCQGVKPVLSNFYNWNGLWDLWDWTGIHLVETKIADSCPPRIIVLLVPLALPGPLVAQQIKSLRVRVSTDCLLL